VRVALRKGGGLLLLESRDGGGGGTRCLAAAHCLCPHLLLAAMATAAPPSYACTLLPCHRSLFCLPRAACYACLPCARATKPAAMPAFTMNMALCGWRAGV
jgi:hypothetical protein